MMNKMRNLENGISLPFFANPSKRINTHKPHQKLATVKCV